MPWLCNGSSQQDSDNRFRSHVRGDTLVAIKAIVCTEKTFTPGAPLVRRWSAAGAPLVRRWSAAGAPLERRWCAAGAPLERRWSAAGAPLVRRDVTQAVYANIRKKKHKYNAKNTIPTLKHGAFKWFGRFNNFSSCCDKTAPSVNKSHCKAKAAAAVENQTVDDMESCFHSPSYARSSDMFTHISTMPRSERRKTFRGLKERTKSEKEEQEGMSAGQSKLKAGECVRDSPLLSALSSLSLTGMELHPPVSDRLLASTQTPIRATPLTSAPDSCLTDLSHDPVTSHMASGSNSDREPVNMYRCKTVPKQDVYVPMDPISGPAHSHVDPHTERQRGLTCAQETSKTASSSQEVGSVDRCLRATDSGGEYVKVNFHLASDLTSSCQTSLKAQVEAGVRRETPCHPRSHDCLKTYVVLVFVFFHLPVMPFKFSKEKFWLEPPSENLRKQLEEELKLSGTNLKSHAWYHGRIPWEVSESLVGNHGDFLVRDSQSSQGDFVLTSHWEQKTLHFLIRKTVVQSSETYTRIQYCLEDEAFDSLPALVHFYVGSRAALTQWSGAQIQQPVNRTLPLSHLETTFYTDVSPTSCQGGPRNDSRRGDQPICPRSPSSLHHKGADVTRQRDNAPLTTAGESHTTPCSHTPAPQSRSPCSSRTASVTSPPTVSKCLDNTRPLSSPSSTLHKQHLDRPQPPPDQHSPSLPADGSCYTQLCPGPQSYVERLRADKSSDPLKAEDGNVYFSPVVEKASCFKPSRYQSKLMPKENKPLEVSILRRVKELLAEVDPRTAARHITKTDCVVARILEVTPEMQRMMGVSSGMELLTLPHGQQLRLDLLERFHTMATMFAVNVLGCTGTNEERAALLHKIIQIAAELKSTMGNMFGFAAVMRALELPQMSRLEETWMALRQRHTEGAILYEKSLRPFMKSLNEGRESCPLSSTTVPHVLPIVNLLEKSMVVGEGAEPWETMEVGMDVVMFHLGAARTVAQLGGIYCSNAGSKLQGFQEQAEIQELFLTDFQLRLLWGSRGAEENQAARYSKFDQVLTALSNKLQPPSRRN
ncbi:SH2 domain containing 3Cb [Xenentodon cancila]